MDVDKCIWMHTGLKPGVWVLCCVGFISLRSLVEKEIYSQFIKASGKSLQNACGSSAGHLLQLKVNSICFCWLHTVPYILINFCKHVHAASKKANPFCTQEVLTSMCGVLLGCQKLLLGSNPEALGGLVSVCFGRLLLEIAAETFFTEFFSLTYIYFFQKLSKKEKNIFFPSETLAI